MEPIHEGKDWIFVSDAHFTGRKPGEMDSFLAFLEGEREQINRLVILGDLFEFFFGFRQRTSESTSSIGKERNFAFDNYLPVFEQLQRLYRHGVRITYFEGNHDFCVGSFFSEHFGMEVDVYPNESEEMVGARRAYIAHGDLSNPRQWKYRFLRTMLKNPLTYGLIHLAGPSVTRRVAQKMNETSYERYHRGTQSEAPEAFRKFARRKFSEGFEIVILGHSHVPEQVEEQRGDRRCLYFNVGDWIVHRSFLRFRPPDHYRLERYRGQDQRDVI